MSSAPTHTQVNRDNAFTNPLDDNQTLLHKERVDNIPEVATAGRRAEILSMCRYCLTAERLRRTLMTALIVGTVLTLLNQVDVLASGATTWITYLKCIANYMVPFIVSNIGMLIGRSAP